MGEMVAIGAMALNRVMGDSRTANGLPWNCSEIVAWQEYLTMGNIVVMSHAAWVARGSKPFPERINIVVTDEPDKVSPDTFVVPDVQAVIDWYEGGAEGHANFRNLCFVGVGEELMREAIPYCSRVEMAVVRDTPAGDEHMPVFEDLEWKTVSPCIGHQAVYITYRR